jgi:KaiC/GvpD/RAD55 family RecA-like ATPase
LSDRLSPADIDGVLIYGPAMSGKRTLALDLLVRGVVETDGRALCVSTTDSAEAARAALDSRMPDAAEAPGPVVIDATPSPGVGVDSPADLTGIAKSLSEAYDDSRRSERLGSRTLVDNIATLLLYTDIEAVYRFLHALRARVAEAGGATIATLDTDGIEPGERRAVVGLFETAVEVREQASGFEYRLRRDDDDAWHVYDVPLEVR